jgi:group I intron endonuclease
MFIYKIINTINKDFYIGKTSKTLKKRFSQHLYYAKTKGKTHLCNAIVKYGKENFIIKCIEELKCFDDVMLNQREIYWIEKLSPKYNMTKGGDGLLNYKHTIETKQKKSLSMRGKNTGPRSEEIKQKISKSKLKYTKPFYIDNIRYSSLSEASKKFNVTKQGIQKRLKSVKFNNYVYE